MDIVFKTRKLEKICNDTRKTARAFGANGARKLRQRLDELRAAEHLGVFRHLPGRCHELTGDRRGQISLDVEHPYRLLFEPTDVPPPTKPDGGLDWEQVRSVRILEVEDTHG